MIKVKIIKRLKNSSGVSTGTGFGGYIGKGGLSDFVIHALNLSAGKFEDGIYNPKIGPGNFNIPTLTSHLTNDSDFTTNKLLNAGLSKKLDSSVFDDLFKKVTLSDGTVAIEAQYGFYSKSFVSAKGVSNNGGGGSVGGASYLYNLLDVADSVANAETGKVLMKSGNQWIAGDAGLNTSQLASYLTANNYLRSSALAGYATEEWVTGKGYLTSAALAGYVTLDTAQTISGAKKLTKTWGFLNTAPRTSGWTGNATNGFTFYRTEDTSDTEGFMQFGVMSSSGGDGVVTDRYFYLGWGTTPFARANNLSVCNSYFKYKNQDVLHAGNYTSYLSNYVTTPTLSNYLLRSGGSMTNTNLVTNMNADLLDGVHFSAILERSWTTAFVQRCSDAQDHWYRIGEFMLNNATTPNAIITIGRNYYSPRNEGFVFSITVGFDGQISITQLSGVTYMQLIDQIRVDWRNSNTCYLDVHIKYTGNTSYVNTIYVTSVGAFKTYAQSDIVVDPTLLGSEYTFKPVSGMKSSISRTLWGQSYDGSGDIWGNISNVGDILFSNGCRIKSFSDHISVGKSDWSTLSGIHSKYLYINSSGGEAGYNSSYALHLVGTMYVSGTSTLTGLLTANGGITVPASSSIKIGEATISWDANAKGLHISGGGLYSDSYISARGVNSSASGGGSSGGSAYGLMKTWPSSNPGSGTTDALGANLGWELYNMISGSGGINSRLLSLENGSANYVSALGTNGNYLTWTRNGITNNITVPYATVSEFPYWNNAGGNGLLFDCDNPNVTLLSDYGAAGRVLKGTPSGWQYGSLFTIACQRNYKSTLSAQFIWDVQHYTENPGILWFRTSKTVESGFAWGKWGRIAFFTDLTWANLLNKPTTLAGYGIAEELNGLYVKKSGDTMTGPLTIASGLDTKFILNNTDNDTNYQYISFRQNDVQYAILGTQGGTTLRWTGGDGFLATRFTSTVSTGTAPLSVSSTTLVSNLNADMVDGLHESNIARYDSSAIKSSGHIFNFIGYAYSSRDPIWNINAGPAMGFGANDLYHKLIQGSPYENTLYLNTCNNGSYVGWRAFAFTDSNVASADKLSDNTARTAWGQTFFANGVPQNVSGTITTPKVQIATNSFLSSIGSYTELSSNGNEIIISGTNDALFVNYRKSSLGYAPSRWVWANGNGSGYYANFELGNMTLYGGLLTVGSSTAGSIKVGSATISWDNNNKCLKVDTGFYSDSFISAKGVNASASGGSTGAVDLNFVNTGSGNAVTSVTRSGNTVTVNKGSTFLTSDSIGSVIFTAGAWEGDVFYKPQNGGGNVVPIPDRTSYLTNDSGFLTLNDLSNKSAKITIQKGSWAYPFSDSVTYNPFSGIPTTTLINIPTNTSHLTNDSGFLTLADLSDKSEKITFNKGRWRPTDPETLSYNPLSGSSSTLLVNIPTNTSHLVNDSGFVTEDSLTSLTGFVTESWLTSQGYATQSWVNSQGYSKWTTSNLLQTVDNAMSDLKFEAGSFTPYTYRPMHGENTVYIPTKLTDLVDVGSSDYRLKTDITATDCIGTLMKVGAVVNYRYNSLAVSTHSWLDTDTLHTGLIYQNAVRAEIPGFTGIDRQGYGYVNFLANDYQATVLGALLQTIITQMTIENELNALRLRVAELERRLQEV